MIDTTTQIASALYAENEMAKMEAWAEKYGEEDSAVQEVLQKRTAAQEAIIATEARRFAPIHARRERVRVVEDAARQELWGELPEKVRKEATARGEDLARAERNLESASAHLDTVLAQEPKDWTHAKEVDTWVARKANANAQVEARGKVVERARAALEETHTRLAQLALESLTKRLGTARSYVKLAGIEADVLKRQAAQLVRGARQKQGVLEILIKRISSEGIDALYDERTVIE